MAALFGRRAPQGQPQQGTFYSDDLAWKCPATECRWNWDAAARRYRGTCTLSCEDFTAPASAPIRRMDRDMLIAGIQRAVPDLPAPPPGNAGAAAGAGAGAAPPGNAGNGDENADAEGAAAAAAAPAAAAPGRPRRGGRRRRSTRRSASRKSRRSVKRKARKTRGRRN